MKQRMTICIDYDDEQFRQNDMELLAESLIEQCINMGLNVDLCHDKIKDDE